MIKAMILAAGRGQRMRPLTDTLPKPLLSVGGKSLIVWHLEKLAKSGVQDVVINTAWLGDKLVQAVGDGSQWGLQVTWSHEPTGGLETAGGVIQALPHLGEEHFLLINGDVWTDYPFEQLVNSARALEKKQSLLVLVPNPTHHPQGDFMLQSSGHVHFRDKQEQGWTFSGLSVLHPAMFADIPAGRLALRPLFESQIEQQKLLGQPYLGLWRDIGTPERLHELNLYLQQRHAYVG